MDSQLKRGILDVYVLSALKKGESYGYKIISDLAPYIEISESTLYPILRRLENSGAVQTKSEIYNGRVRKYFGITQLGLDKIAEFVDTMAEFKRISAFIMKGEEA